MSNKSQATREKLCEAAIEIAARDGLSSMTLDNVARHAGVSKGGVTYHFPSKEKLVEGVVEHFGDRLERLVLERVAHDPQPRHRWARAMLDCTFEEAPAPSSAASPSPVPPPSRLGVRSPAWPDRTLDPLVIERFFLAVLAAATTHPGVIAPLREVGHRVRARLLADPRDGFDQLLLWLALDGLLLWQFAGLIDRNDPLFAQVGRALRARVDAPGDSAVEAHGDSLAAALAPFPSRAAEKPASPRRHSSSTRSPTRRLVSPTPAGEASNTSSPRKSARLKPAAAKRGSAKAITPQSVTCTSGPPSPETPAAQAAAVRSPRTRPVRSSATSSTPARLSRRRKRSS